jgi:DNA modification methylase
MTTPNIVPNSIMQGDCLTALKTVPDASAHCCITSPPYYHLRDYGVQGQIGLEDTPTAYIEKLVQVFREVRRVLRPEGTLWLVLGDTYAHDNKWGGHTSGKHALVLHGTNATRAPRHTGLKAKDLMMIPARVAIALCEDGWWLRQDIIWHKTTAMPEPVTDRPVSAHDHIFLLAKSQRYFYDADAIREPLKPKIYGSQHRPQGNDARGGVKSDNWGRSLRERHPKRMPDGRLAGANKRNVWSVASQPRPGAHYATFPPKLIEPAVLAGTSAYACEHCGAPWQRMVVKEVVSNPGGGKKRAEAPAPGSKIGSTSVFRTGMSYRPHTVGWQPTCVCSSNDGVGKCVVLDPFMGSGTVALVALAHGRNFLGIEINPKYIDLANERLAREQPPS